MMDRRDEILPRLNFSIDRDGRVLNATLTSGTGSAATDQDMLDWVGRLQPFPRIPDDLLAPMDFSLEMVLVPPAAASDVKIKWIVDAGAPARESAIRDQVASHLQEHPVPYFDDMKAGHSARRAIVALSIDSEGKLLNIELIKATGSPALDYTILRWLRGVPSYPHLPSDLTSPLRLAAEISFQPPRPIADGLWNDGKIKRAIGNVCRGC